jgi:hypothetical protein
MVPSICGFAGNGSLQQDTNLDTALCCEKFDMAADMHVLREN